MPKHAAARYRYLCEVWDTLPRIVRYKLIYRAYLIRYPKLRLLIKTASISALVLAVIVSAEGALFGIVLGFILGIYAALIPTSRYIG